MTLEDDRLSREEIIERMTRDDSLYALDTALIRGVQYKVFRHAFPNLNALFRNSRRYGDAESLVFENERYSYAESCRRAAVIAQRLVRDCDVRKGDRVAIAMRNYPEWCLSFAAISSIGAVAVALNSWWQAGELVRGLEDSQTKVVIVDPERLERLKNSLDIIEAKVVVARTVEPLPKGVENLSLWLKDESPDEPPSVEVDPDDAAAIFYTSGSEDYPKGVLSTHRAIISVVMSWSFDLVSKIVSLSDREGRQLIERWLDRGRQALGTNPLELTQTSTLVTLPLFHVTGCHAMFLLPFWTGRKIVMMRSWNPEKALELIETEKITAIHGVPTQSWDLINCCEIHKRDISSVKMVGAGGAPRPPEHLRRIANVFSDARINTAYGMTETNALATNISGDDYLARPTSVGRAVGPLCEVKIVDSDGSTLGPNIDGEICIKSPANFCGYWNRPKDTEKTLRDGWVYSGDIGHLDQEGFLYITDRAKDMVLRGGENISCTEVENALCEHPAVLESAVFGVPDERLGEVVWAEVAVNPSEIPRIGEVDERELSAYLSGRIADFKIPARIRIRRNRLDRGTTEKIDKRRIRARAIKELLEQSQADESLEQDQLEQEQIENLQSTSGEPPSQR